MVIAIAILLVLVFIAVVIAVTQYDRYRPRVRHEFIRPTTEVHVDPVTGVRQRVYVNPATGERAFVDEPVPLHGTPPPLERPGLVGTSTQPPPRPPEQLPPSGAPPPG